jgi:NTE family protein
MRALVLSGGGSLGAFQAGAIQGLAEQGATWDLVVGTSVGALNGAFLACAPKDEQRARAAELVALWSQLHTRHVHRANWFGALAGIVPWLRAKPSFRSTTPLRHLVERYITGSSTFHTKCIVSAVELQSGRVHTSSSEDASFAKWVLASAAIPLVFPPVEIDGASYVDGGIRRNDPVSVAVAEGADEIDIILCFPRGLGDWMVVPPKRALTLTTIAVAALIYALDGVMEGDIDAWTKQEFKGRQAPRIRVFAPASMTYVNPVSFDPAISAQLLQAGRAAVGQ